MGMGDRTEAFLDDHCLILLNSYGPNPVKEFKLFSVVLQIKLEAHCQYSVQLNKYGITYQIL